MDNPFLLPITSRLDNIESKLSNLAPIKVKAEPKIVDLKGLLMYRSIVGTKATVYKLVHEGRLPHYKPEGSKTLYFLLEEIDNYLLGKKVKTCQEIQSEADRYLSK